MRLLATLFLNLSILYSIAQVPLRGLVAYYPFDNNAIDKSGNRNDGEVLAGVQTTTDRHGNECGAMAFDGKGGYISVANSQSMQGIRGAVTVATWFKLDASTVNEARVVLFSKGSTGSNPKIKPGYHIEYLQSFNEAIGKVSLCCGFTDEDRTYNTHRIEHNQWCHLVIAYDESWVNVYLNGKMIWQGIYAEPVAPNDFSLDIGRSLWLKPDYYKGSFDEYRIYNRGLNAAEVAELYNYIPPAPNNVLTMHVPADMVHNTDSGKCSATVVYAEPTANVGCGKAVLRLAGGKPSGSMFAIGNSTITYEATYNGQKEVKAFNITVRDSLPPVFEYAREVVAHTYDTAGTTVHYLLGVSDNCGDVKSNRVAGLPSGSVFPIGKTEVKYDAVDFYGNKSSCSFTVSVVKDDIAVTQQNEEAQIADREDARPAPAKPLPVIVEHSKPEMPKAVAAQAPKPAPSPVAKPAPPAKTALAKAVDVACGTDLVKVNEAGKCGAIVNYNAPKARGQNVPLSLSSGVGSNQFFPVGITNNSFSATDAAGFVSSCSFNVKVKDIEKPVINCPHDTIIMLSYNRKGIIYNYTPPTATDNCAVDSFIQTIGSAPGCFLPVGEHPFAFEAIDAAGNKTVCGYSVSVRNSGRPEQVVIPQRLDEKLNMGDDAIKYEHEEEVNNCLLTIFVYDDGEEDGDSVSLVFDGQVLVDHQKLRLKENGTIKRQVALLSGNPNYIVAKAWNTGRTGLNTMRMDIYEGFIENEKRDLRGKKPLISKILHARPGEASGIILKCNW